MTAFEDRFWSKVVTGPGCWIWTGATNDAGYGHVSRNGRFQQAHRVAYEMVGGEIPEGFVIDHLCRITSCVRPSHLEPVTQRDNLARGKRGGYRRLVVRPDWRTALDAQGRTLRWLAVQTGKSPRTIYAYSRGDLIPPDAWLAQTRLLLGEPVTHVPVRVRPAA